MSTENHHHINYRADIDGLRAIAVLAVIIFHAFPNSLPGGFIGVDIFFVISGFLISGIVYGRLEKGTFCLTDFYVSRVRRIFPALIIVLTTCIIFGWFSLLPDEYRRLGKHVAGGAAFISNLILWGEAGYFDSSEETKPLLHLWSLGIEGQFYLFWPFLIWLSSKMRFSPLVFGALLILVSFLINIKQIDINPARDFYSPITRLWELVIGSIAGWLIMHNHSLPSAATGMTDNWLKLIPIKYSPRIGKKKISDVASIAAFAMLIYSSFHINKSTEYPGKWTLIPTISALLIIYSGPSAAINRVVLSNKLLVWIGLISYPLYLWHWPLLSFARIIDDGRLTTKPKLMLIFFAFLISYFTYRLVERPIRRAPQSAPLATILIAIMLVVGASGYQIFTDQIKRLDIDQIKLIDIITHPYPQLVEYDCKAFAPELSVHEFNGGCKLSNNNAPTIIFIGDSHVTQYKSAIWNRIRNETVLMVSQTNCLPFANDSIMDGECRKKYFALIDYIKSTKSIKKVYLSGYWSALISGVFVKTGLNWRIPGAPRSDSIISFINNGSRLISSALMSGKEVFLIRDIPDLDFNIMTCFDLRPWRYFSATVRSDCFIDESEYERRNSSQEDSINKLVNYFPSIKLLNPRSILCKNLRCYASDGKFPYYLNGDHLNHYGASLVVDGIFDFRSGLRNGAQ